MRPTILCALLAVFVVGCKSGSESLTPAPRSEAQKPDGWKEIATSGFAISMPSDWKAIDLTQADLEKGSDAMLGNDPKMDSMRSQIKSLAAQGIFKVFVFDTKTIGTGFADNCNVTESELPSGATLDMAVDQTKTQIAPMLTPGTSATSDKVTISVGSVARIRSQLKAMNGSTPELQSLAYMMTHGSKLYGVTFTCRKGNADDVAKVAEKAMNSFRFTD